MDKDLLSAIALPLYLYLYAGLLTISFMKETKDSAVVLRKEKSWKMLLLIAITWPIFHIKRRFK